MLLDGAPRAGAPGICPVSPPLSVGLPVFDNSQIECINYVLGIQFSRTLNKSTNCLDCKNFLTSHQDIQVCNDKGF